MAGEPGADVPDLVSSCGATIGALPVAVAQAAGAARTMPHTLRAVELADESMTALGVLRGFDDDLAGQITATSNRIR